MRKAKQSTAKNVMVLMVDETDHITGLAGLTLTITASKDGAAFGSIAPTMTDRGNGWYVVALTSSHTDTLGDLALHITGAAADPVDMVLLVEGGATDVDVSSRMAAASYTAPLDAAATRAAIGLASANLDTQLAALPTAAQIVAAQLTTAITESYRANGGAPTLAQFMSEVLAHLGEASITGTIKTLKKFDHATTAETFTLDSATAPTSIVRAS